MINVTIAETDHNYQPTGQTVNLTVDTSGSEAQLREVSVKAVNGAGILNLPTIDYDALVSSIVPSVRSVDVTQAQVRTTAPAAKAPARKATASKKAAPKKTAVKKATAPAAKKTAAPKGDGTRAYRTMPADFAEVATQLGESQKALMEHYSVPRHTVSGWLRNHRKAGAQSVPVATPETPED